MDVNDAELLALAGDDSSDEGNTPVPSSTAKVASPLPPASSSHNLTRDPSAGIRSSTPNTSSKSAAGKRTKKMPRKADSEEEGEAQVNLRLFFSSV